MVPYERTASGAGRLALALFAASLIAAAPALPAGGEERPVPEPPGYRMDDYRAPVPPALAGARVVGADEARKIWAAKSAVFIDVYPRPPKPAGLPAGTIWRDPVHETIPGAAWLPNVGYGALSPEIERYFAEGLARLKGGDPTKPIVFFCQRNCWMSWNAAKRAMAMGHRNVIWFSEGTDAWLDLGEELARIEPER